MLDIHLTSGKRLRVPRVDSLTWRDGLLVCVDARERELSFKPDEIESIEVLPDKAEGPRHSTGAKGRTSKWYSVFRPNRVEAGAFDARLQHVKARISGMSEMLADPQAARALLRSEDAELSLAEWKAAASEEKPAPEPKSSDDGHNGLDGRPAVFEEVSTESLIHLLTGEDEPEDETSLPDDALN